MSYLGSRWHLPSAIALVLLALVGACGAEPASPPSVTHPPTTPEAWPTAEPSLAQLSGTTPIELIYRLNGSLHVVAADGQTSQVAGDLPEARLATLSTDGRWLVSRSTVEDLTTGEAFETRFHGPARAWSPNGNWLLSEVGPDGAQQLLDLAGHRVVDLRHSHDLYEAIAVLDDGTVLEARAQTEDVIIDDPNQVTLNVVIPATGDVHRQLTVAAAAALHGEEAIQGRRGLHGVLVGPDDTLLLRVAGDANSNVLGVLVSLRDGKVVRRIDPTTGRFWVPYAFGASGITMVSGNPCCSTLATISLDGSMQGGPALPAGARLVALAGAVLP